MSPVRIGICSWADEALTKAWYPDGVSARERLGWYAQWYSTVEVDSTYYRLPAEEMVRGWAERTPPGFVMHVKAFGMMTRHPVKREQLPPELRDMVETDARGRVDRPPREVRAEAFRLFREALRPLRDAGKLGGVLFQLPQYVVHKPLSLEYLEWAREQLPDDELLVEFRHRSWLEEDVRADVLAFLESRGMTYVTVDAPKTEAKNLIPTVPAVTSETAYVRFHGRNAATWNVRGGSASKRFTHLYAEDELAEWVEPLRELAGEAANAYAMFNNNGITDGVAQAPAGAQLLRRLLDEGGVAAEGGLEPAQARLV